MKNSTRTNYCNFVSFLAFFLVIFVMAWNGGEVVHQLQTSSSIARPSPKSTAIVNDSEHVGKPASQCLSLEGSFSKLIESTNQIFLSQTAKASGTSFNDFASKCQHYPHEYWFLLRYRRFNIGQSYNTLASILSQHVEHSTDLTGLVTGISDDSVIIHSHRGEDDRLLSAIRQVLGHDCEKKRGHTTIDDDGNCFVEENKLIQLIVSGAREIKFGSSARLWNCETFEIMKEYQSNVIVMDYKQAEKVQEVLVKKYCPELLKELPLSHSNTAGQKMPMFVRLLNETESRTIGPVKLDDWLKRKKEFIPWIIRHGKGGTYGSCRGKLREMEATLDGCEDGIMAFTRVPGY